MRSSSEEFSRSSLHRLSPAVMAINLLGPFFEPATHPPELGRDLWRQGLAHIDRQEWGSVRNNQYSVFLEGLTNGTKMRITNAADPAAAAKRTNPANCVLLLGSGLNATVHDTTFTFPA